MCARPNFASGPNILEVCRAVSLKLQPFRAIAILRRSAKTLLQVPACWLAAVGMRILLKYSDHREGWSDACQILMGVT
jgi:hypothetical protein